MEKPTDELGRIASKIKPLEEAAEGQLLQLINGSPPAYVRELQQMMRAFHSTDEQLARKLFAKWRSALNDEISAALNRPNKKTETRVAAVVERMEKYFVHQFMDYITTHEIIALRLRQAEITHDSVTVFRRK